MSQLNRSIGLMGAAGISIGAIIGAGIFVLSGVASGLAGPSVILSFAIAGIVAFLTALSSAELSSFITDFSNYQPLFPMGVKGMLSGAAIIFFAFAGFNTVTVIAEEVKVLDVTFKIIDVV